ncbi:DEAD box RNA helicase HelA [Aspergillus luchuensis]|uniref:DEAD box RNA helicase HelA n=1 Tax=Aspergillus kawachii TaxID=1069201 RepID=A0A146F7Y4_ASPKA|nr:DEAD box RNA helicase HelA [Aspergillus luchuensis]
MAPAPSVERLRELFSPWETGDGLDFIDNVLAPDCRFVVRGSHRYADVYDREGIKAVEMEVLPNVSGPGNHCDRMDFSGCGRGLGIHFSGFEERISTAEW